MDGQGRDLLVVSSRPMLMDSLKTLQWRRPDLAVRRVVPELFTLDEVHQDRTALVMVEIDSPEAAGLDLCNRLGATRNIDFIVLLSRPDPYLAAMVLDCGAHDCLALPIHPQEISLRIQAILRRIGYEVKETSQRPSSR